MDLLFSTDNAILLRIGEKIRARRINMQLTQQQAAQNAGVSESSVYNVERGKSVALSTLVAILRSIHSLELLEALTSEDPVSPIAMADALKKNQPKQRVRSKKQSNQNKKSEW